MPRSFVPGSFALTVLLGVLTALGPLSTDLYLPSLPSIGRAFAVDPGQAQLTLSFFLGGFALGLPFYGPLSDRLGRRRVMIVGLVIFIIACLGAALSQSLSTLIVARFFQGLGTAGPGIIARSIVRDLYSGPRAAQELSRMGSIMALVPMVAPILGVGFEITLGWRANFFASAALVIVLAFLMRRHLPETLHTPLTTPFSPLEILRDYGKLLTDRRFWPFGVLAAATYSGLLAFISGSSFLFQQHYGFSELGFALLFTLVVLAYLMGSALSQSLSMRHSARTMLMIGAGLQATGGVSMIIAALIVPQTAFCIVIPMMIYNMGVGLTLPQSVANAMLPFPDRAGTASSLLSVVQLSVAAIIGVFIGSALVKGPIVLALVTSICGVVALLVQAIIRLETPPKLTSEPS